MSLHWEVAVFVQIVLGLVLIQAGAAKVWSLRRFAELIREYRILPAGASRAAGAAIPLAEIGLGAAWLTGFHPELAAPASIVLFAAFAAAVAVNLCRGRRDLSCGCLGVGGGRPLSWMLVWRNLGFSVLALVAQSRPPITHPPVERLAMLLTVTALFCLGLLAWVIAGLLRDPASIHSLPTGPRGSGPGDERR